MSQRSPAQNSRRRRSTPWRKAPASPLHQDPGLQPERTVMSWGRTLLALCVCALMFLRWYPNQGTIMFIPLGVCVVAALLIHISQRRRYATQSTGISAELVHADVWAVTWLVIMVVVLVAAALVVMWLP